MRRSREIQIKRELLAVRFRENDIPAHRMMRLLTA